MKTTSLAEVVVVYKHGVIFVNGKLETPDAVKPVIEGADFFIAADGGLVHLRYLDLWPHLLIGDLDSVTAQQVAEVLQHGGEVRKFPLEKNETDLDLAFTAAIDAGCERITVVGALGGRLDQTLANIYLLTHPNLANIDTRIDDGIEEVFVIRITRRIQGQAGEIVSLLPISLVVKGVTTHGLRFPLLDEDLFFSQSRGVSNVMLGETAQVEVRDGFLLCIHTRSEG